MAAKFKSTVKNSYSFDIDMPVNSSRYSKKLMGYIVFENDGSVTFKPLHIGNSVSVKQSISTLSYVLNLLKKHITIEEF